jgi:hypothetical protein
LASWCDSSTGLFRLPRIGANHGGLNYAIPSNACGLTVTPFTWQEDCYPAAAQPDKSCQVIQCGVFEEVRVDAFGWCFEGDNGMERFAPEQLAYFLAETRCRYEHLVSQRLLNMVLQHPRVAPKVLAPDTHVAGGGSLEAEIYQVLSIRFDNMRRDLANPNLSPHVIAPAWVDDVLMIDNMRRGGTASSTGGNFAGIVSALGGTAELVQHWQAVSASASAWPADFEMLVHAPGVFREVDGGNIDFGLIRDSTLNKQNKFRMMFEKFDALAFIGPDCAINYVEVTNACPSGAVGPRWDSCNP